MIIRLFIIFIAALLFSGCESRETLIKETISAQDLSNWQTLDKGKTTVSGDEITIEEVPGSDGYFLISPESYEGDLIMNYKVKAVSESSVLIVLFSASDKGASGSLTLPPPETKGSEFWTWRTTLEHYNLTFNNRSHGGNKPFLFKNISPLERGFFLRSAENIMEVGEWYDVEIGKQDQKVWFKLNNQTIFEQEDCQQLSNGHIMFRISGTNGDTVILAKAVMKDLVIFHE